jgi:hypothetical protein
MPNLLKEVGELCDKPDFDKENLLIRGCRFGKYKNARIICIKFDKTRK